MKKRHLLNVALLLFILTACDDGSSPVSEVGVMGEASFSDFSAHMLTPGAFNGEGLSEEERDFIAKHSIDDQMKIIQAIEKAASWDAAHIEVQKILSTPSELPDYIREQRAAIYMLKAARSLDEFTEVRLEAVAYYTDLLGRHRSPEAGLMVRSLELLGAYWSEDKIREVAARGVEGADAYLDSKYYCADCPAGKARTLSHEAIQENRDVFITEVLSSVEVLRALSVGEG